MNLDQSVAAFVLGFLPSESLPDWAVSSLQSGLDSTSLAALAGTPAQADPRDLQTLFRDALRELNVSVPSPIEAAEVLKRWYAAQVAAGELRPREGARLIVEEVFRRIDQLLPFAEKYLGESFGIARLVGLFYSYDDVADTDHRAVAEIDDAVVRECDRIATGQAS